MFIQDLSISAMGTIPTDTHIQSYTISMAESLFSGNV